MGFSILFLGIIWDLSLIDFINNFLVEEKEIVWLSWDVLVRGVFVE